MITPTLTYASGTWTLSKDHERMIRSAQRKMLRLIVQSKRKYKNKAEKRRTSMRGQRMTMKTRKTRNEHRDSAKETEEGSASNTDCDQDSDVSFSEDEEEWIEYIKRSTREAEKQMKKAKIPCWIETHRRMRWILAMRTASLPDARWSKKISEWNPGLDSSVKTSRPVGRPKKEMGR